jgi:hypothetical protein
MGALRECPHLPQKRAWSGYSAPQDEQDCKDCIRTSEEATRCFIGSCASSLIQATDQVESKKPFGEASHISMSLTGGFLSNISELAQEPSHLMIDTHYQLHVLISTRPGVNFSGVVPVDRGLVPF